MSYAAGDESRGRFAGVLMILRYNWPLYGAGLGTALAGATVAASRERHRLARIAGAAAALGSGWLSLASVAASWWVYDRSELYRWTWLARCIPAAPGSVLVVHAGLDEASGPVTRTWPAATVESVDVHGGIGPTTASLRRARTQAAAPGPTRFRAAGADAVVAFLAAHELRSAESRAGLLAAVRDSLRPGGRLVLVEHARDLVNALAYGPAIAHFYPAREWRRVIAAAGLDQVGEERVTPFVVVLTAERPVPDPRGLGS